MEKVLATVNINMGQGPNNPVLTINSTTNVPKMLQTFIQDYQLPPQTYHIILAKIQEDLAKQDIKLSSLGKTSKSEHHHQGKENVINRPNHNQNRVINETNKLNSARQTMAALKSGRGIAEPLLKPRNTISPFRTRINMNKDQNQMKEAKITLIRTKSPIRVRQNSQTNTTSKSPFGKTPPRCRQTPSYLSQAECEKIITNLFHNLTRNQPKTIKIMSPQFICFNGIKPGALEVLQQFFESVEETQFCNMDKYMFIRKIRQLGFENELCQQLMK